MHYEIVYCITLFSSGRSFIALRLPAQGCFQCSNQANTCSISLPLSPMLSSPSVDLFPTPDLWIVPSGRGSPTNSSAVPEVSGGDSSAGRLSERARWLSTRLRIDCKKLGPRSPPTCLGLEQPVTASSTSEAVVLYWQLETIEKDTNQNSLLLSGDGQIFLTIF